MSKTAERLEEYRKRNLQSRRDQMVCVKGLHGCIAPACVAQLTASHDAVLDPQRSKRMSAQQQMAEMAKAASASAAAFESKQGQAPKTSTERSAAVASNKRAYYKHMRQVVERADVVVEVLDARDPLVRCQKPLAPLLLWPFFVTRLCNARTPFADSMQGCRAREVENLLLKQTPPKRIILVRAVLCGAFLCPGPQHLSSHVL